jgi:hypothetical protein
MTPSDTDHTKELNENLIRLNENLERQLSFKFIILKGAVYGLGTAVGATIIAGLVLSLLANTFDRAEEIPILPEIARE